MFHAKKKQFHPNFSMAEILINKDIRGKVLMHFQHINHQVKGEIKLSWCVYVSSAECIFSSRYRNDQNLQRRTLNSTSYYGRHTVPAEASQKLL